MILNTFYAMKNKPFCILGDCPKILIFCPIGLGNFIMASQALRLLSKLLGSENIQILALKTGIDQMARESGWFGKVHFWDPDKMSIWQGVNLLRDLRKLHFDYSISLYPTGHWKFCLFSLFCGAKVKTGFKYPHTPLPCIIQNYSHMPEPGLHDAEQNMTFIQTLLANEISKPGPLILPLKSDDGFLEKTASQRYFICHPGSSTQRGMTEKRLPGPKFAQIIKKIYERFNLLCALCGGPEEAKLRREIAALCPGAILNLETANLNELSSLIEGAAFYLGNDSGIMHMSAALAKNCIAFFGPSDETRTGPYYLNPESEQELPLPHRGHLVLRNPLREQGPKPGVKINPRLLHKNHGLQDMDMDWAWERIEPFLGSFLDE